MTSQAVLLKEIMFLDSTLPAKRARYHHQKNNCNLPWREFQFSNSETNGFCDTTMCTLLLNY